MGTRSRSWWLLLALVAASCAKPPRGVVESIEVESFVGGGVAGLSREALQASLRAKLEAEGFREKGERPVPAGVPTCRLTLAAGLQEPDVERQAAQVAVVVGVRATSLEEAFEVAHREMVRAESNDVAAMERALRDALEGALGGAVREATALVRLAAAPADERRAAAAGSPGPVRDAAIRLLAREGDHAALAPLLARLPGAGADEVRAVMGLLVELGDPGAAPALIDAVAHAPGVSPLELAFALGAIGGPDAEAWLDLTANGHEDPRVREGAAQALRELRSRGSKSTGGSP